MDELLKAMGQTQGAMHGPTLERIASAAELSAALAAFEFFKAQGSPPAALDKLRKVIQARTSKLSNGGS